MNDHDEIDQARREFSALAGKVKDATASAAQWRQTRRQQAERARERSERAHDRAEQRGERAARMAERAQRLLRTHWRQVDRDATADLAVELEAGRLTRAQQERLVGEWARAQAHADENPEEAAEFDARIRNEIGIDPDFLRNPTAFQATQPFTPFRTGSAATDTAVATDVGIDTTPADESALIRGLIDAAHPDHCTTATDAPPTPRVVDADSAGLLQHPQTSELDADPGGGELP